LDARQRDELPANDPRELLEQFFVLRYASMQETEDTLKILERHPAIASVGRDIKIGTSSEPNDPYFKKKSTNSETGTYQWGLQMMNFPMAWDLSPGHSYIGVLEPTQAQNVRHEDLDGSQPDQINTSFIDMNQVFVDGNHRAQFDNKIDITANAARNFHSLHVMGIIGASTNNNRGVAGACPNCSLSWQTGRGSISTFGSVILSAVTSGMQVINWSGGIDRGSDDNPCASSHPDYSSYEAICAAVSFAQQRQVSLVVAAGNSKKTYPQWPGSNPASIAIGAAEMRGGTGVTLPQDCPNNNQTWCKWIGPDLTPAEDKATNDPGIDGIFAPGRSIVSTVPVWGDLNSTQNIKCTDQTPGPYGYSDESSLAGDGYGSCTGTSMAAPYISGLIGIMRSINPLLPSIDGQDPTRSSIKYLIKTAANYAGGMPNASTAVQLALSTNSNRLTPLFSFYSAGRSDTFSTTSPQMASAAASGTLQPRRDADCQPITSFPYTAQNYADCRYYTWAGNSINGYTSFPGGTQYPSAMVFLFTIPRDTSGVPLVPLYRFSWKCGDPTPLPPAICNTYPAHVSHVYSADTVNGLTYFKALGYKLDGIEGYIYPRTIAQPPGTVKLIRKYNPAADDYALFSEPYLSLFYGMGYTEDEGTEWIGYVYPN
jgi:hypothetical protein